MTTTPDRPTEDNNDDWLPVLQLDDREDTVNIVQIDESAFTVSKWYFDTGDKLRFESDEGVLI